MDPEGQGGRAGQGVCGSPGLGRVRGPSLSHGASLTETTPQPNPAPQSPSQGQGAGDRESSTRWTRGCLLFSTFVFFLVPTVLLRPCLARLLLLGVKCNDVEEGSGHTWLATPTGRACREPWHPGPLSLPAQSPVASGKNEKMQTAWSMSVKLIVRGFFNITFPADVQHLF